MTGRDPGQGWVRSRLPGVPADIVAYLLAAIAGLCWAGNHVAGRFIANEVPPAPPGAFSAARWLLAAAVVAPFAWRHLVADWPRIAGNWRAVVFLGLVGGTGFSVLQYYGLRYTTAVNVSVLNSAGPAFIIIAGVLIFRDVVRAAQLGGVAMSLIGVLVILTRADPSMLAAMTFNVGDLMVLANMGIFAIYSAALRLRPPMHPMTFMLLLSLLSCLGSVPFGIVEAAFGNVLRPTWPTLAALLYTGLFTSVTAYLAWNAGIAMIGVQRAGPFLHLVPLFGAILSMLLLGEEPALFHAVGLILIISGVTIAARRPAAAG